MALLDCRGCARGTNTVFVEHEDLLLGDLAATRCAGRYTGRVRNEVERGCGYEAASARLRERVDRAASRTA